MTAHVVLALAIIVQPAPESIITRTSSISCAHNLRRAEALATDFRDLFDFCMKTAADKERLWQEERDLFKDELDIQAKKARKAAFQRDLAIGSGIIVAAVLGVVAVWAGVQRSN